MTPIIALVDYDPDGLAIYSVYKYGSTSLAHESKDLVVSELELLGLRSCTVPEMGLTHDNQAMLQLSTRDRLKAMQMLQWRQHEDDNDDEEMLWRRELQLMLMLNAKAEIQLLQTVHGGIVAWLRTAISKL